MEKILTGQNNCDIFDEILSANESIINGVIDFNNKKSMNKTLLSCVKYMDNASCDNNTLGISFGFNHIGFNEELSNAKVRYLAAKLACAIDSDSVEEIRRIKKEYGNTAEFSKAKDFLNKMYPLLKDDGIFYSVTDDDTYALEIMNPIYKEAKNFKNILDNDYVHKLEGYGVTLYEEKMRAVGHNIYFFAHSKNI